MLKAKTLKNLALTFGEETVIDDTLTFKKYRLTIDDKQYNKWISECRNLEAAGMFKPDANNGMCPDTYMAWHGYLGTKFDRIGVMIFRSEVVISYKTKSAIDKM